MEFSPLGKTLGASAPPITPPAGGLKPPYLWLSMPNLQVWFYCTEWLRERAQAGFFFPTKHLLPDSFGNTLAVHNLKVGTTLRFLQFQGALQWAKGVSSPRGVGGETGGYLPKRWWWVYDNRPPTAWFCPGKQQRPTSRSCLQEYHQDLAPVSLLRSGAGLSTPTLFVKTNANPPGRSGT